MTANTLIILNPHAGSGRAGALWREIEPTLWRHMGDMVVAVTQHPDEVANHIEQAHIVGIRRVIALGGDGTNHFLVNALTRFNERVSPAERMVYGNIPVGTGRDWARGQGLLYTDPARIAQWIIRATPTPTDLGLLQSGDSREYFLNIASAGMGGEVSKRVNRTKTRRPWTFLLSTVTTTLSYRPQPVQVQIDGRDWYEGGSYAVVVANGSTFGHGMKIAPRADTSDGLFEVIVIKGVSRLTVLMALRRVYNATHLTHPGVLSTRAASVTVSSPGGRVEMELDGEYSEGREARFTMQPAALNMLL